MIKTQEFYTTPDGDVMMRADGETRQLLETDKQFIADFITHISEFYPDAYAALCAEYARSRLNRSHYEYLLVKRFIKCNFGEYDNKLDVTDMGHFQFEYVKCPMRGECKYEGTICNPKFNSTLSPRELDVMELLYKRHTIDEISETLYISIETVKNHRRNALQRLRLRSTSDFIAYAYQNNLFNK